MTEQNAGVISGVLRFQYALVLSSASVPRVAPRGEQQGKSHAQTQKSYDMPVDLPEGVSREQMMELNRWFGILRLRG
ncbi:MAG: hypothetical protein Rhims3KO_13960 [Hyphomicrobiales bacterium]